MKYSIVIISDKGSQGLRGDKSGPAIEEFLKDYDYELVEKVIIPDEEERIKKELIRLSDDEKIPLILTSGGTGFSKRDVTPEATLAIGEKRVDGIVEEMRRASREITPMAILSRAVSVIRGDSLIINLPGSPKASVENLEAIIHPLKHGLEILLDLDGECAR